MGPRGNRWCTSFQFGRTYTPVHPLHLGCVLFTSRQGLADWSEGTQQAIDMALPISHAMRNQQEGSWKGQSALKVEEDQGTKGRHSPVTHPHQYAQATPTPTLCGCTG
uniref:Uncharacterized protein n=1 Tax=Eutreptiella gymnastica TaxID=73025 RepID=A0A7S1NU61_9EUGL|mmetsp:Transcript_81715/g.144167  ORF Transcript_81715/g.144167 Transcript_81715/m.144167 type:complete len:108 (+) Transcript_81715:755-1078(+)